MIQSSEPRVLSVRVCVPISGGTCIEQDQPGIICCALPGAAGGQPLVLVADERERNEGASATNSIELVLSWLAQHWAGVLEVREALVVESDSSGDYDFVVPQWDTAVAQTRGRDVACTWRPLTWPGAKARSEAAFRGLFGRRAELVLAERDALGTLGSGAAQA